MVGELGGKLINKSKKKAAREKKDESYTMILKCYKTHIDHREKN